MIDFLNKVKEKISIKLNTAEVTLIDNSHLHAKHKSFKSEKFYIMCQILNPNTFAGVLGN